MLAKNKVKNYGNVIVNKVASKPRISSKRATVSVVAAKSRDLFRTKITKASARRNFIKKIRIKVRAKKPLGLKKKIKNRIFLMKSTDSIFSSFWIGKIINAFIKNGKKSWASREIYKAFRLYKIKFNGNAVLNLLELIEKTRKIWVLRKWYKRYIKKKKAYSYIEYPKPILKIHQYKLGLKFVVSALKYETGVRKRDKKDPFKDKTWRIEYSDIAGKKEWKPNFLPFYRNFYNAIVLLKRKKFKSVVTRHRKNFYEKAWKRQHLAPKKRWWYPQYLWKIPLPSKFINTRRRFRSKRISRKNRNAPRNERKGRAVARRKPRRTVRLKI
jgi:hypothetical protein